MLDELHALRPNKPDLDRFDAVDRTDRADAEPMRGARLLPNPLGEQQSRRCVGLGKHETTTQAGTVPAGLRRGEQRGDLAARGDLGRREGRAGPGARRQRGIFSSPDISDTVLDTRLPWREKRRGRGWKGANI